jgi:hypothetical protein
MFLMLFGFLFLLFGSIVVHFHFLFHFHSPFAFAFVFQLAWLERDLAAADSQRGIRPWVFVSGHRPMVRGRAGEGASRKGRFSHEESSFLSLPLSLLLSLQYSVADQIDGVPTAYASNLQHAMEALFEKYNVDVYFCGHKHSCAS